MYNNKKYNNPNQGVVGNYLARIAAAAFFTFAPSIAMANNAPKAPEPKKEGIEFILDGAGNVLNGAGKAVGNYFKAADKCRPLDDYLWELNIEGMAWYAYLLPGSCAIGLARPVGGAVIDAPKKAMELADAQRKSEKRLLPMAYNDKEKKGLGAVVDFMAVGAWNNIGNVIEFGRDCTCFTEKYAVVFADGTIKYGAGIIDHAFKKPADTAVKGIGSAVFIRWLSDAAHRTEHHSKGGEAPAPEQAFPPVTK